MSQVGDECRNVILLACNQTRPSIAHGTTSRLSLSDVLMKLSFYKFN